MNRSELIECVAQQAEMSKLSAEKAVSAILEAIQASVAKGEEVRLVGFGTFKGTERKAREGKNPKTGEALTIAATRVPAFKAGAVFKARVAPKALE